MSVWKYSTLDSNLGHSNGQSWFGYKVTELGAREDPRITLVVLGGSTSVNTLDGGSWDLILGNLIRRRGYSVRLLNGATGGYSSSQEALKLLRDIDSMEPDIVVSLSGINDVGCLHQVPKFPYTHRYQTKIAKYILENNAGLLGVTYGVPNYKHSSLTWLRNQEMMSAICSVAGAKFFGFLQPILGIGQKSLSESERRMWQENCHNQTPEGVPYGLALEEFYQRVTAEISTRSTPDVSDLKSIFDCVDTELFRDFRHQNAQGDIVIAEAVDRVVQGWFSEGAT